MPEAVAAMLGAILLFLLPVNWTKRQFTLTWDQAARIEWGIVLLYGGGLALGDLAFSTGLARAIGEGLTVVDAGADDVQPDRPVHRPSPSSCPRRPRTRRRPT